MRPILGTCNSPYHSLSDWLASLLEPVKAAIAGYGLRNTSRNHQKPTSGRQADVVARCNFPVAISGCI